MTTTRREFLGLAATASVAPAFLSNPALAWRSRPARTNLRILILGGTGFIGPYVVRHAIERGHTVTLFNRGRTNVDLFPEVEKLVGDRDPRNGAGLTALEGREWDACLDNTGYIPRHVRASTELLRHAVDRYLFTSSRMAFADFTQPDKKEDAPLATMADPTSEDRRGNYGALKALCEQVAQEVFDSRCIIVRPTCVAGPGDTTDRFTYWPDRINKGGEVLAPGDPTDPVMYIDVRDLAEFMIHLLEREDQGVFNAVGPQADLSVAELLYGCRAVTSADVRFTWVPAEFLAPHDIVGRRDVPIWTSPKVKGDARGFVNRDKAVAHGLTYRPLAVTALDTLQWHLSRPEAQRAMAQWLSLQREREILAAWHARG